MLVKVFKHGQGGGDAPVNYLCALRVGILMRQPKPTVLRGSPLIIRELINAVPFKNKYSSGVLSFAPEDAPTDEQLDALMNDFEDMAFAGMEASSRSILWVQHTHFERQ